MSRVGDLVVDAGVVFVITFDGRQSLLGERRSMEPLITAASLVRFRRQGREARRRYPFRKPRPTRWGRA